MQVCYPHRKISNLYRFVVPEKSRGEYERICSESVSKWEECHRSGMSPKKIQGVLGISRATYYRRKRFLMDGIIRSKRPRVVRITEFSKDICSLMLRLRKENPTYGKFKIRILLKRDHGIQISESSVGRILSRYKVPRSRSALRVRRKRKFIRYAKPWRFKEYTICGIRRELLKEVERYNTYRPHHGLKGLTPMEYVGKVLEASSLSQMM
jgi:transposase